MICVHKTAAHYFHSCIVAQLGRSVQVLRELAKLFYEKLNRMVMELLFELLKTARK